MPYSDLVKFQKDLVKNSVNPRWKYAGLFSDYEKAGLHIPKIPFRKMTLSQTGRTMRACPACIGTGIQSIKHITGQVTIGPCNTCQGKREVLR